MKLLAIFVVALCVHLCICEPLIKVFCAGGPLFRGRLDSIVSPGVVSGHVHKVAGASNFGPAQTSQTPLQVYNDLRASPCTTCSIPKVDLSAYWHPELYYRWPNGSLQLVPGGGLTVYYLARNGPTQQNPAWKAFPPGFRMLSGSPFRRTYDPSSAADNAITFACLSNPGAAETHNLSVTANNYCVNGLRLQVHFPQCWDGVNVDSANHMDHVAFPVGSRPDGGDCPASHPVRIVDLFFEAFYSVSQFPHGPAPYGDGKQHFVLACGDDTGLGFHGDFLNGWDQNVLQAVLQDPSCDATNTNEGNSAQKCAPVSQYVLPQAPDAGVCNQNRKVPLTENIGFSNLIHTLAGCNPITTYGQTATPCSGAPSASEKAPVSVRFHLRSELNQKYLSCPNIIANDLTASISNATGLTYYEVFVANPYSGQFVSLQNEGYTQQFLSSSGSNNQVQCSRGSPSDWEAFQFVAQANGKVAILSKRNNLYLSTHADGTIVPDSSTVGTAQLFTQVVPQGGSAF